MARISTSLTFTVRNSTTNRRVTIQAFDSVGVEDVYSVLFRGALHRLATGEDLTDPVSREIKDWIIRTNLFI